MSARPFAPGDRVRVERVRHDSCLSTTVATVGAVYTVKACDYALDEPCISLVELGHRNVYADQFTLVPPAQEIPMNPNATSTPTPASATPRPFAKGDRVRVVKLCPGSGLRHTGAKIGDVFTISQIGAAGCIVIAELNDGHFASEQFALVVDAPPAPAPTFTPGTRVTLPDGTVAAVTSVTAGGAVLVNGEAYDPARLTLAPPPPLVVPEDADTMLRVLDAFLARGGQAAEHVQHIVSALRGPDERGQDKSTTTCPVRRAALPECAKMADRFDTFGCHGTMAFDKDAYRAPADGMGHFDGHILSAVRALRALGREVR